MSEFHAIPTIPLRYAIAAHQTIRTVVSLVLVVGMLAAMTCSAAEPAAQDSGKIKVALIGDSTVTTSSGWGRTFPDHFNDMVQVLNFAKGGRSSKSWYDERLLPAVLRTKPDYVFIQFGHNDQPGKGPQRETDPDSTYREFLKMYVTRFRAIGATPVIVSSVARRRFNSNGKIESTLTPWADAARAVAADMKVPFIDLHSASITLYQKLGPKKSMTFNPKKGDTSHFNSKGSKAISSLVVQQLDAVCKPLAKQLK